MPYITKTMRSKFDDYLNSIPIPETKGELEYCVFKLMQDYMKDKDFRYSTLHDCVYAVQHCSDEFRRRFLDKREDEARKKNGDV